MVTEDHNINAEAVNDRAKLILHRLLAREIRRNPSLVEDAKARVSGVGPGAPGYVKEWLAILDQPLVGICREISSRSINMRWLRLSTPFRPLPYMRDVAWRKRLWKKARLGVVDEARRKAALTDVSS